MSVSTLGSMGEYQNVNGVNLTCYLTTLVILQKVTFVMETHPTECVSDTANIQDGLLCSFHMALIH